MTSPVIPLGERSRARHRFGGRPLTATSGRDLCEVAHEARTRGSMAR